jgi:hypothetical protein
MQPTSAARQKTGLRVKLATYAETSHRMLWTCFDPSQAEKRRS